MGVSFYYTPKCAVCIYLFVCDIKSEYSKNTLCVRPQQTYALLHKTYIKVLLVLRYQDSTSVDPLSNIAHQMWHDHPFSQRNRKTEKTVGLGV